MSSHYGPGPVIWPKFSGSEHNGSISPGQLSAHGAKSVFHRLCPEGSPTRTETYWAGTEEQLLKTAVWTRCTMWVAAFPAHV